MSTVVQHRRGNKAEVDNYTPKTGELIWNTETKAIHIGDGAKKGGHNQRHDPRLELKIFQSSTDNLTKIETFTVDADEVYEVRKTSDDSLATIYSDDAGTTEIVQNGTDNKSGSDGVVEFYIADGDYYVEAGGTSSLISTHSKGVTSTDTQGLVNSSLSVGSRVRLTDRSDGLFVVMPVGLVSNGLDVIGLSNGTSAEYSPEGGVYNVKHIGAKGDKVTDDTNVFKRGIELVQAPSLATAGQGKLYAPTGWYVINEELSPTFYFEFEGDGMMNTILDSRGSSGWLFSVTGVRCKLSSFGFLHSANGGIKLTQADRSELDNLFTGVGSTGGTSYLNDSSQNCLFHRIYSSVNGNQINVENYNIKPDKGIVFVDGTTAGRAFLDRDVVNMTVLRDCQVEGAAVEGFEAINDTATHSGQGYLRLYGCTFQGNGRNMHVKGSLDVACYGCHVEVPRDSDYDMYIDNCQNFLFVGGASGHVRVTNKCVGTKIINTTMSGMLEDEDCINSDYTGNLTVANNRYKYAKSSTVSSVGTINNYNSDISVAKNNKSDLMCSVLSSNGTFSSWYSSTSPVGFDALNEATLNRITESFSASYSCRIDTDINGNSVQGLKFDVNRTQTANTWVTVSCKIKRPASSGDVKFLAFLGYNVMSTVAVDELPADEWIHVSRSFKMTARTDMYVAICPTPGDSILVDDLVVSVGKVAPNDYATSAVKEIAMIDDSNGLSEIKRIRQLSSTTVPAGINVMKGDQFYVSPVSGGYLGYVAINTGVTGSTAVMKGFGLIES